MSGNNLPATCRQNVMAFVDNLVRREPHIVVGHETDHLLMAQDVGVVGEVLVHVVGSNLSTPFSVYSSLGSEGSGSTSASSNASQVKKCSPLLSQILGGLTSVSCAWEV